MIEYLKEQLERTNYWLSFAEAKHAALIAVNIAFFAVCIDVQEWILWGRGLACVLIILSSAFSVLSFWPNLAKRFNKYKDTAFRIDDNNIFYAENAKKYTTDEFLEQVASKYGFVRDENKRGYEKDIAFEILENSQIAMGKYAMFKGAIILDLLYFAIMILLIIIA